MSLKFSPAEEPRIRSLLEQEGFMFLDNDNAFWRAKKGAVSLTFFRKGTLLIQSPDKEKEEIIRLLTGESPPQNTSPASAILGLDESGKGDCFGPLVLAGVIVTGDAPAGLIPRLRDSKQLTENSINELFPLIEKSLSWQVRVIEPRNYNRLRAQHGNLNQLMINEYIGLIRQFSAPDYEQIILDKFSQSDMQNRYFSQQAGKPTLIVERAESYPAVAAASIVARYHFLLWMREQALSLGEKLPLGSGEAASSLFRRLQSELPADRFSAIAKTHFTFKA